jgi:hypothetical protein
VCVDNEFPLPDWFQRFGAVQTLSVLRLCGESLWRQACSVQVYPCCWVGDREKGSFCAPRPKKWSASFSEFSVSLQGHVPCQRNLRCSSELSVLFFFFFFFFALVNWYSVQTMWNALLCVRKHFSIFCSVLDLLCWDSTLLAQIYVVTDFVNANIAKSLFWCIFGWNQAQDSWNEIILGPLQWLTCGEDWVFRLNSLRHLFGVSLKLRAL